MAFNPHEYYGNHTRYWDQPPSWPPFGVHHRHGEYREPYRGPLNMNCNTNYNNLYHNRDYYPRYHHGYYSNREPLHPNHRSRYSDRWRPSTSSSRNTKSQHHREKSPREKRHEESKKSNQEPKKSVEDSKKLVEESKKSTPSNDDIPYSNKEYTKVEFVIPTIKIDDDDDDDYDDDDDVDDNLSEASDDNADDTSEESRSTSVPDNQQLKRETPHQQLNSRTGSNYQVDVETVKVLLEFIEVQKRMKDEQEKTPVISPSSCSAKPSKIPKKESSGSQGVKKESDKRCNRCQGTDHLRMTNRKCKLNREYLCKRILEDTIEIN